MTTSTPKRESATVVDEHELGMIRDLARKFSEQRIKPIAERCDREGTFPLELVAELGELGLLGAGTDEEYGGSGASKLAYAIAVEEVYRAQAGIAASVFMSPLIAHDILLAASEEQKRRLVPPLVRGEAIAALAVTEPEAGSDAASIRTRAVATANGFRIDGYKRFITNATIADLVLVLARTTEGAGNRGLSLFAVEASAPGLQVQAKLEKAGWRCSDTADIAFEGCEVPAGALIGRLDEGFKVVMNGFNLERIVLAAGSLGLAQAAVDETVQYGQERVQFGRPIGSFQSVAESIARMAASLEAARQLTYHAARKLDAGQPCSTEASMAKLVAAEMCQEVTAKAIHLHGGAGFTMELPVQRFHRDSLIMSIGGGTSEIQSQLIARSLGLPKSS